MTFLLFDRLEILTENICKCSSQLEHATETKLLFSRKLSYDRQPDLGIAFEQDD